MTETFTDGVSLLGRGRAIKAIDLCPATITEDGKAIKWNNTTKQFDFVTVPTVPTGTDQQVLQFNGTTLTAQDLILASKSIDNTVVPTDGQVLTYESSSGKVKFKTVTNTTLSEIQFLATQAAAGNLVLVNGTRLQNAGAGAICSYTPAAGKTFTLFKAQVELPNNAANAVKLDLRNNGTIKDTFTIASADARVYEFNVKGDQLIGDGAKIYDIYMNASAGAYLDSGSIEGYIT